MKTRVDERLREGEAERFSLRFACDDCAHFDAARGRCSLDYPAEPRRGGLRQGELEFCKAFELG